MLLSLALITATAYCELAPVVQPVSHKPPQSSSPTSSSSASSVAATTRKSAVSEGRQSLESFLLENYKNYIIRQLNLSVNEDGVVVRSNGTSSRHSPISSDIINSSTPINISIDGKRGEQWLLSSLSF